MAKQLDYENKIVTAGRFIERGGKQFSLTQKLKNLSFMVSSGSTNTAIKELEKITSDNVVTPDEKISLKQEWEYIQAAFASISATVTKMDKEESEEYLNLKTAYEELASAIEPILSDMNSTSELTEPINPYIENYTSSASVLNIYLTMLNNQVIKDISDVMLKVVAEYDYVKPYDSVKLTAMIMVFNDNGVLSGEIPDSIKELYKDPETGLYPKLYQWSFSGTTDDDGLAEANKGQREVTIPYSSFIGRNIKASFYSELIVGEDS